MESKVVVFFVSWLRCRSPSCTCSWVCWSTSLVPWPPLKSRRLRSPTSLETWKRIRPNTLLFFFWKVLGRSIFKRVNAKRGQFARIILLRFVTFLLTMIIIIILIQCFNHARSHHTRDRKVFTWCSKAWVTWPGHNLTQKSGVSGNELHTSLRWFWSDEILMPKLYFLMVLKLPSQRSVLRVWWPSLKDDERVD